MRKNYFLAIAFLISLASVLWLFSDFLKGALVAWLLVMVSQSFAIRLENRLLDSRYKILVQRREIISAAILTLGLLLVLLVPLIYLTSYAFSSFNYQKILLLKSNLISYIASLSWLSVTIKAKITAGLASLDEMVRDGQHLKQLLSLLQSYLANLGKGAFNLGLVVVMFFLFHWYRRNIISFFVKIIPLELAQQRSVYRNVSGTLSIVFLTIFAVAVAQGVAFGVLMLFFKHNPLLLGFFIAISSVVPVFSTALIWVPLAISEVAQGNLIGGLIIAGYGSFVLSFLIDNFVRLFFLNRISKVVQVDYKINEFLLFFSIAAGIAVAGFWGVLIGPALIALFIALSNALAK